MANDSCPDPFFLPHKEEQKSGLASRDYPGAFCPRITIIYIIKCDRILENGFKSHIFISVYLILPQEKYCILNNISYHYVEFNAQITERI